MTERVTHERDAGVVRYGIGKLGKVSLVVLTVIVALVFIGALIPSEGDDASL